MFATRSEYDRGVNTFSPEGRLFQVEYALGAMKLGSTAIAVATKEGVIFASERRSNSPLLEFVSLEKIMEIDDHIACAMSGLIADAKTLVDHARSECVNHTFVYNERMGIRSCVESIADLALEFSDVFDTKKKKTMSRPFGVALLVGGIDVEGPVIWCVDPSGTIIKYKAAAIGSAQEGAESILLQKYDENMEFSDAEVLVLEILRQVMEEKMSPKNVEMARIRVDDVKYREYDEEALEKLISSLPELPENLGAE
ncbi:putative proteasome subunit alpha type-5 [Theileria parva strain Muguga]|uniref:Proteasome subunit alpha type n=1 Tax=Theileria parva TaxID=5875 RepID=Q4N893_THEPA|nr:putative proteasome subunit alpha type-5 [Theileria parva strain Muguga]EAN33815.1 putative proteasome subunit alpha type-5 [Theileria parva strain Muguga]|eukprot:XP_766098.1 proteasome subunit alpha type 5 [Theileria parva strain Muguga]